MSDRTNILNRFRDGGGRTGGGRRLASFASTLLLAVILLAPIVACAAEPTLISAPPLTQEVLSEAQTRELSLLLGVVRENRLDAAQRREAAMVLLNRGWTQALAELNADLLPDRDPTTKRIIAQALVDSPDGPPAALLQPLLGAIGRRMAAMQDVAGTLAQRQDGRMIRNLTRIAADDRLAPEQRGGALLVLAHHRNQVNAGLMMQMIDAAQPQLVRDAAFLALTQLTGISEFGSDAARWQSWWQTHRELGNTQWLAMILDNFAQRNRELVQQHNDYEQRLLEAQRHVYRITADEARGALLAAMLVDPMTAMRLTAVQLADTRLLTAGRAPEPELRAALLGRLDDPAPEVRRAAVRLLRELRDPDAADHIANSLIHNLESNSDVMRSHLSMMARMPRASVVDRAVELMGLGILVPDVAAMLAAAAEQQLLSQTQSQTILQWLRQQLYQSDRLPEAQLVTLLGRIGSVDDWPWIERWLGSEDVLVRRAAAEAWANSQQPLVVLALMGDDAVIQPILINAAMRRGRDPNTMAALIEHRPAQEQLAEAWQRAVVAMASRMAADEVLKAEQRLAERDASPLLRAQVLTAAIEQIEPRHEAVDLLLVRASVRLGQGDSNQALADLNLITSGQASLTVAQRLQLQSLASRARLANGDIEGAMTAASQLFGVQRSNNPGGWTQDSEPIIAAFLGAARRAASNQQQEQAQRITSLLLQALGSDLPAALEQRIAAASRPPEPALPPIESVAQPPAEPAQQPSQVLPNDEQASGDQGERL